MLQERRRLKPAMREKKKGWRIASYEIHMPWSEQYLRAIGLLGAGFVVEMMMRRSIAESYWILMMILMQEVMAPEDAETSRTIMIYRDDIQDPIQITPIYGIGVMGMLITLVGDRSPRIMIMDALATLFWMSDKILK